MAEPLPLTTRRSKMNPQQLNQAKQRKRRLAAGARIQAWEKWRAHGYDRAHRPDVLPKDNDFKLVRGEVQ